MTQRPDINQLSADQLRALATELMDSLDAKDQALGRKERELVRRNAIIEKLGSSKKPNCSGSPVARIFMTIKYCLIPKEKARVSQ